MAWSPASLRDRFYGWLIGKAVAYAFDRLSAQHLGQRLNAAMDDRFGKSRADAVQVELASWLRQVSEELEA